MATGYTAGDISQPVKVQVLLSKVQTTAAQDDCKLEYSKDGKLCELQTQEQLDEYLRLPNARRPQLCVTAQKSRNTQWI